ncbi:hypothetical protein LINGRAHAP2_LOCUS8381 [Linum grandiflorum]
MGPSTSYNHQQHLSCEIAIHQSKNVEEFMIMNKYYNKPHGNFFVRYYLSIGTNNHNKIQLQTREVSSSDHLSWNESFSLDCLGSQDSFDTLKTSSVLFELRWRPSTRTNILGRAAGSKLVGRAELQWESVMELPSMEIEKWVVMNPKNSKRCDDVKPPSVRIGMRVGVPKSMEIQMKKNHESYEFGCSCRHSGCCSCADYDVLALVAAFEAI